MLPDKLSDYRIILASRSPRRQQLLRQAGLKFDVVVKDFDESYPVGLNGEEIARYIAERKAESFRNELNDNEILITADTIVWCDGKVLGKPADINETISMLGIISGNTHEVITGVSIISRKKKVVFSDTSKVVFEALTDEEIRYYAEKFRPLDKAGAYGIQEWIGLVACSRIEGSYFNVVGLPVQKLYNEVKKFVTEENIVQ
ncbi:MAG TPA: Maf family nucleotide pyrophosphatase [Bacteroidales bacterium]|jgi:septum formation protein|nr:Maf family nucleotide pyrophosphatase [Bacteroidales bacterium]